MNLSQADQAILALEIKDPAYDGMTSAQAYAWLFDEQTETDEVTLPLPAITPLYTAGVLGPAKAEAIAKAVMSAFPTIGPSLLAAGVDPTNADVKSFLAGLVAAAALTQEDVQKLTTPPTTSQTVKYTNFQRRFGTGRALALQAQAQVTRADGEAGFPNHIDPDDFAAVWAATRGTP